MMQLADEIYSKISELGDQGDKMVEEGHFTEALALYWQAFDLLPEPKNNWDAGTWILAAIGDTNFRSGDFVAGRDNLAQAMHFPNAIGNPFMHLRLGQCWFELGTMDRAADELMRAYMGDGPKIFAQEDAKYIDFLATQAKDIKKPVRPKKWWWPF